MSQSFHFEDTPPQVFLDALHQIDIPRLYDPAIAPDRRANLINLSRKRLKEWLGTVEAQIKAIKQRYGKEDRIEASLTLAPYDTLRTLGKQLGKKVSELEHSMKTGRVLPKGFAVGDEIFGDFDTGEWRFGSREEANAFEEMMRVYHRLDHVQDDLRPLNRDLKLAQARVKQQKGDVQNLVSRYNKRKSVLRTLLMLLLPLVMMVASLAGGWFFFNSDEVFVRDDAALNQVIGGGLLLVGLVAAMVMIVLYRRRRRALNKLKQEIRAGKALYKEYKDDFKELRLEYYPVNKLYQQLRADYGKRRKAFPKEK